MRTPHLFAAALLCAVGATTTTGDASAQWQPVPANDARPAGSPSPATPSPVFVEPPVAPPSAVDPSDPLPDPRLQESMATARRRHVEGTAEPLVAVEVLTVFVNHVAFAVDSLGGSVTGSVPGAVVQAMVPVDSVRDLALSDGVQLVRAPRLVNRRPGDPEAGFGPTSGQQVAQIGADQWHDAGITGTDVKVGIVDYFRMDLWNTAEHGPVPSVGNGRMFCLDSFDVGLCSGASINGANGDIHGVAVAEIVKDVAPGADLYIATVATLSDLGAAIDWLAGNGVHIMTRSLGAAYDGPGDGTGPLAATVDYAASKGLTWFNSGGNDADHGYLRINVPTSLGPGGYVDFNDNNDVAGNSSTDQLLRLDGDANGCFLMDGVRWSNDWYLPAYQVTDYRVEVWQPVSAAYIGTEHTNPTTSRLMHVDLYPSIAGDQYYVDFNQRIGEPPLEMADEFWCTSTGVSYLKIRRNSSTPVGATPDTMEIAMGSGFTEFGMYDVAGSAAKPVVDSRNPALVSVGALDTATDIAVYSSQGPTNDGRVKPDLVELSCITSTIYTDGFCGTSASSPAAAGVAAMLLGEGLAVPGAPLAALVKHLVADLGTHGPDNTFGWGRSALGTPPDPPPTPGPTRFVALGQPTRIFDSRPESAVNASGDLGPYLPGTILDLDPTGGLVTDPGLRAVVLNITTKNAASAGFVQAYSTLREPAGATSSINISVPAEARPNLVVVEPGELGRFSAYLQAGGHLIVDIVGWFEAVDPVPVAAGRFVSIQPERWLDTGPLGPAPATTTPQAGNASIVEVAPFAGAVPNDGSVAALVVNVTADIAGAGGFLRAEPTGASGLTNSTVNYEPGQAYANTTVVPLGAGGTISVYSSQSARVIVDVVGYITSDTATPGDDGLLINVVSGRNYDSRLPEGSPNPLPAGTERDVPITGFGGPPQAVVPAGAGAVIANLVAVDPLAGGYLLAYPAGGSQPSTSNVNFAGGQTVANAAFLKLGDNGEVTVFGSQQMHVIIDVNGYFTGTT